MKLRFRKVKLSKSNIERLTLINSIVEDYQRQGYKLTLRQLYYQLVSRDVIANKQAEYSNLSKLLKEGRMGGIVDWDAIEDRLRVPDKPATFSSPKSILEAAASQFRMDRQKGQSVYLEVWVEKDALSGVLSRVTHEYHVPIMVNRGYSSASAMYDAYNRFADAITDDGASKIKILYLGDFDPSGKDMIRDVTDRVLEFFKGSRSFYESFEERYREDGDFRTKTYEAGVEMFGDLSEESEHYQYTFAYQAYVESIFEVCPIALTDEQIREYNPPPNPAKISDPRAADYIAKYGDKSWEVDALKPEVLDLLLHNEIRKVLDQTTYNEVVRKEREEKIKLKAFIENYN